MKNANNNYERLTAMVISLYATLGDDKGEIELQWDADESAECYIIQMKPAGNKKAVWRHIDIVNSSKYTVSRLTPARIYEFRIAAVGKRGQGVWSKPILKKAK
ncbi:MAG TPA: fibronectin type III domain-containing protein [Ignavibacteria bacterium]|jgi:hypothetical protein